MQPLFETKPHIPTLINRIINVVHRLALKMDLANSDEYIVYMNNGFWSNYSRMEIANAFTALKGDEQYDNLHDFHTDMIVQVIAILLALGYPLGITPSCLLSHCAVEDATANAHLLGRMLTHYLQEGRYPHESITDRVYYDRPLFAADAEEGRCKRIRNIIDVLVVMLSSYLSPIEANYQYQYLVFGIHAIEKTSEEFNARLSQMQHRDIDRLTFNLCG